MIKRQARTIESIIGVKYCLYSVQVKGHLPILSKKRKRKNLLIPTHLGLTTLTIIDPLQTSKPLENSLDQNCWNIYINIIPKKNHSLVFISKNRNYMVQKFSILTNSATSSSSNKLSISLPIIAISSPNSNHCVSLPNAFPDKFSFISFS